MRFEILRICNKIIPQSNAKIVISAMILSPSNGEVKLILVALKIMSNAAIIVNIMVNCFMFMQIQTML